VTIRITMARPPKTDKNTKAASATTGTPESSPAKAAIPTYNKFNTAFNNMPKKTLASTPVKGGAGSRITHVDINYEATTPLGTGILTFTHHARSTHAYIYPLLSNLFDDPDRSYNTFRIVAQAVLYSPETPDRKLKKPGISDMNIMGLVVTFDTKQDQINETNVVANLLKVVRALVVYANRLANRPNDGDTSHTFTYANDFQEGQNYTRAGKSPQRPLGLVISPEDSVNYMEQIFKPVLLFEIARDKEIMTCMYGSVEHGNAIVAIAKPSLAQLDDDGNQPHTGNDDDNDDGILPPFVADA
jgi:hypothetical protein